MGNLSGENLTGRPTAGSVRLGVTIARKCRDWSPKGSRLALSLLPLGRRKPPTVCRLPRVALKLPYYGRHNVNYSTCRPGRRCKQWRVCDACARIRQAQIADVAEAGAAMVPRVTYAVARTYDAHSISRDREKFVARLAQISEGGLWTIETGERAGGLHVNVIAGTLDGLAAADLAACWPGGSSADFWATDVPRRDVRKVAAYSSKREALPAADYYGGRLYGSWGTWKRPLAALVEDRHGTALVVAGAALQTMLHAAVPPVPTFRDARPVGRPPYKETASQRAERMQDNADRHAQALQAHAIAERAHAERQRLRTLFAAHAGELTLKGVCYIPGYGVATLAEARRMDALP